MKVYRNEYIRQFTSLVDLLEIIDNFNILFARQLSIIKENHNISENNIISVEDEDVDNDIFKSLYFKSFNTTLDVVKEIEKLNILLQSYCCELIDKQLELEDMYINISLERDGRVIELFKKLLDIKNKDD